MRQYINWCFHKLLWEIHIYCYQFSNQKITHIFNVWVVTDDSIKIPTCLETTVYWRALLVVMRNQVVSHHLPSILRGNGNISLPIPLHFPYFFFFLVYPGISLFRKNSTLSYFSIFWNVIILILYFSVALGEKKISEVTKYLFFCMHLFVADLATSPIKEQ